MPGNIQIPYTITFERQPRHFRDLIQVAQIRLLGWPRITAGLLAGPIGAVGGGIFVFSLSDSISFSLAVAAALSGWSFGYFGVAIIRMVPVTYVREQGTFAGEVKLTIDDRGIRSVMRDTECFFAWHAVETVIERKESIILVIDAADGLLVPKSAFASTDERLKFIDYVNSKICFTRP